MVLVRPVGTILPWAVAMMSTWPKTDHPVAMAKNRMTVAPTARPTGDAGVSRISRAAGRNCRPVSDRPFATTGRLLLPLSFAPSFALSTVLTLSSDDMETRLDLMQHGVAPCLLDQLVMRAVLDQPTGLDGDDPVGIANGRKAVSDDEDGAAGTDPAHVALDDALAFVVERAGRLVENQDARVRD